MTMKKLKATVENIFAHPDEPEMFEFEFGLIILTKIPRDISDKANMMLFSDMNLFKSFSPDENMYDIVDKLDASAAFNAMKSKAYNDPKHVNSKSFNTLEEALIDANLKGFSDDEITVIDAHGFH